MHGLEHVVKSIYQTRGVLVVEGDDETMTSYLSKGFQSQIPSMPRQISYLISNFPFNKARHAGIAFK